ncbi:MAG: site-2 protease family protein [Armatimonadetes bacterium]|nr:site-2 protease family protein [Armatimonadota bacterium]
MPNILAAIAAFGAMIFFHELGHFLMAKRAGVRVHAFALGFGPQLMGWTRGETTYSLNLLPFGGFVRMEGEDESPTDEGSFRSKSVGARIAIIVAGPLMNLVSAVFILALAAAVFGEPIGPSTRVGTIEPGWPAAAAGLQPGDEIVAIDGVPMQTGDQVIETIHRSANRPLVLTMRRGGRDFTVTVTPRLDAQRGVGRIGFQPLPLVARVTPMEAIGVGVRRTGQYIVMLGVAVQGLVREGRFLESLGGPVAAGSMLAQTAQSGAQAFLYVAAFLSVMIGIFNLLPIPALDGGRLAFLVAEAIRRRPLLDARREHLVHTVGFALLLLLLFSVTVRDFRRLFL